ncbi:MAG: hypothetical protein QM781_05125 [Chitinophagaceae bacterium]
MRTKKISLLLAPVAMLLLLVVLISFSSFKSRQAAADIWASLGISKQAGTDNIRNSFLDGYLHYYGARNLKSIALQDRQAIARDLLSYTREFVSGATFKAKYTEAREYAKPVPFETRKLRTVEEIQKEEIEKTEKSIKDTEKSMKELGGEVAKSLQPVLEMLKQNLKDYKNPKNEMFTIIADSEKRQQEDAQRHYEEATKQWKKDYPENINLFIAGKLRLMLEYTNGIDYAAALVEKYGKKRFVNPTYEAKRTEWKQGFRAGKDVTETAREFVKKWLSEIEK